MKIGLDFDGVISDCGKLKSDCAKMLFGVDIPGGQFKRDLVIGNGWLTEEQYQEITKAVYYNREVGTLMEPVDGVVASVPKLFEAGHKVLVITSREEINLEIAREWIERHRLPLELVGVGLHNSKAQAAMGLDVYVDDDLHKLRPLVGIVPNLFLFSWEYNHHFDEARVAIRVSCWKELYRKIGALADV
ncbi:MAG: hypothetical protein HY694_11880 [Deltaproteobacteria bacterium]|nr:hypothetical protein [Deltaproteobacteria bacterium]